MQLRLIPLLVPRLHSHISALLLQISVVSFIHGVLLPITPHSRSHLADVATGTRLVVVMASDVAGTEAASSSALAFHRVLLVIGRTHTVAIAVLVVQFV